MIYDLEVVDESESVFTLSFVARPPEELIFLRNYLREASSEEETEFSCWTKNSDGSYLFQEHFLSNPVTLACRSEILRMAEAGGHEEFNYLMSVCESLAPHWW